MRFNCLKAANPLRGDSLHFTTKSLGGLGTDLAKLGRMQGWVNLRSRSDFEPNAPGLTIHRPNH